MEPEKALAVAVQTKLRSVLAINDTQCNVEMDELLASMSADLQINVIPNGVQPGPLNSPAIRDRFLSIAVQVAVRSRHVARDKRRKVYLDQLTGLAKIVDSIVSAIDGNYLYDELDEQEGVLACKFIEPLLLVSMENRPKVIMPMDYGSDQNKPAAHGRLVTFGKARWISG